MNNELLSNTLGTLFKLTYQNSSLSGHYDQIVFSCVSVWQIVSLVCLQLWRWCHLARIWCHGLRHPQPLLPDTPGHSLMQLIFTQALSLVGSYRLSGQKISRTFGKPRATKLDGFSVSLRRSRVGQFVPFSQKICNISF